VVLVLPSGHRRTASVVDLARRSILVEDPRLIRPVDVGTTEDTTYVVLPVVEGVTLTEQIHEGGMSSRRARSIIGEAAEALADADGHGLHHGTLTPDKIRLDRRGRVRITGTGVDAALAGTLDPDPERSRQQDTVDLIRLLYTALTGLWPGQESDSLSPAPRSAGQHVPPAELTSGIDPDLDALCTAALGSPAAGPTSPEDLAHLLSPWDTDDPAEDADGLTLTAPPLPVPPSSVADPPGTGSVRSTGSGTTPTSEHDDTDTTVPPGPRTDPVMTTSTDSPAPSGFDPSRVPASREHDPEPAPGDETDQPRHRRAGIPFPRLSLPRNVSPEPVETSARTWEDVARVGLPAATSEIPAPFVAPVPVRRPPQEQAQFVVRVTIGFLVVVSLIAAVTLIGLGSGRGPATTEVAATTSTSTSEEPTPTPTETATATATASATPDLVGIQALDPQGDGTENDDRASNAIDRDPETVWKSSYYATAAFAGLKKGVGLALRMADDTPVQQVTIDIAGKGGVVELRTAEGPGLDGSTVVARSDIDNGKAVLTPSSAVNSRWLILWFTTLPKVSDRYQLVVSEIGVR
jgi:hypothetical protein